MNLLGFYAFIFIIVWIIIGIKLEFKKVSYLKSMGITIAIIILGFLLGIIPINAGKCGDNAFYIYNIHKTVRVFGNGIANLNNIDKDVKKIVIYYGIDEIENCNFSNLKFVKLADSIVSIKDYTFYGCTNLENVKLPKNLKVIGFNAFYNCKSIDNIEIPDSVEKIYGGAFSFTNISEINIPDNTLFNVYDHRYSYARAYEENTYTFYGCSNLKKINISENNKNYINIDGVVFNNDKTKIECYPAGKESEEYVIPNTIKNLEQIYLFAYCNHLKKLTISNIDLLNKYVIYDCENLEIVEIQEGVKNIHSDVIQKCPNLSKVYIKGDTQFSDYDSSKYLFIKDKNPEEITIYCKENSCALKYAIKYNYKYVIIDK